MTALLSVSAEFDEAADLLSADPGASTLSVSALSGTTAGTQDTKVDLSEDEENQQENSGVS